MLEHFLMIYFNTNYFVQHGRLKVRTTAEQQEIKAKERAKKLVLYKAAIGKIVTKVLNNLNCDFLYKYNNSYT